MSIDEHLFATAQRLIAAADADRPVLPILKGACPQIHQQIIQDGRQRGILGAWGRSCNVDENAGQVIVHPGILAAIGQLAGVQMRGRFVHAGLEHTYGYLFSVIDTPFGPKRQRWLSTDMEKGFGLDPTLLSAAPRTGTLLANLTWFLARIVFRDRPREFRALAQCENAVAPELVGYDYAALQPRRIVERWLLPAAAGRRLRVITDLVPYPHRPRSNRDDTLLIYAVETASRTKLITAVPVGKQLVQQLTTGHELRKKVKLRLRYNAYAPGLYGRECWGYRALVQANSDG